MIGMNVFYIVTGIAIGSLLGYSMKIFNKCSCLSINTQTWIKFFLMVAIAISMPVITYYLEFEESKYIAIIFYGYVSFVVWGDQKPDKKLAKFWKFCQPLLFSSIGASVLFKNISSETFGKSFGIIVIGLLLRWLATFFASAGQNYTKKERAFLAFAWMPKATVQAAIGGTVLDMARSVPGIDSGTRALYVEYGNILLSTAVLAIVFTAPIGAILINTLGIRWLSYDGPQQPGSADPSAATLNHLKPIELPQYAQEMACEEDGGDGRG